MQRLSLFILSLALAFSCASGPKPKTQLLVKQQSFAVISVVARYMVTAPEEASMAVSMAAGSQRGSNFVEPHVKEQLDKLAAALKGTWVPVEDVVKAKSYATLPAKWDNGNYLGLAGTRPLHMEKPKEMGAFAQELNVDAVVLIRHELALRHRDKGEQITKESVNISGYYGIDHITTVIISNAGEVLFDSTTETPGPSPQIENAGTAVVDFFNAPPTPAVLKEALESCVGAGIDAMARQVQDAAH